jgi:excisionase family DNA binding protein
VSGLLSTRAFALRCGVVPETVREWIAKGRLEPAGRTPGGHYRFSEEQVATALAPPPPGPALNRSERDTLIAKAMAAAEQILRPHGRRRQRRTKGK